jgi:hypothetical protein
VLEITLISLFVAICAYFSIYFFFFKDKRADVSSEYNEYVYYSEKLDKITTHFEKFPKGYSEFEYTGSETHLLKRKYSDYDEVFYEYIGEL